jgi:hypothetical protein
LDVIWEWEEAGGKRCQDVRCVKPQEPYVVSVGELDFKPSENPKYMKRLEVRHHNMG